MKILSNKDYANLTARVDDYEALAPDYHNLARENAELRAEIEIRRQNDITRHHMDEKVISHSQHMTEYTRPDGQTVREVSYSHKTIVEKPRAEPLDVTLTEWFEQSPFIAEMKKAR